MTVDPTKSELLHSSQPKGFESRGDVGKNSSSDLLGVDDSLSYGSKDQGAFESFNPQESLESNKLETGSEKDGNQKQVLKDLEKAHGSPQPDEQCHSNLSKPDKNHGKVSSDDSCDLSLEYYKENKMLETEESAKQLLDPNKVALSPGAMDIVQAPGTVVESIKESLLSVGNLKEDYSTSKDSKTVDQRTTKPGARLHRVTELLAAKVQKTGKEAQTEVQKSQASMESERPPEKEGDSGEKLKSRTVAERYQSWKKRHPEPIMGGLLETELTGEDKRSIAKAYANLKLKMTTLAEKESKTVKLKEKTQVELYDPDMEPASGPGAKLKIDPAVKKPGLKKKVESPESPEKPSDMSTLPGDKVPSNQLTLEARRVVDAHQMLPEDPDLSHFTTRW